jgi:hypothetical protein
MIKIQIKTDKATKVIDLPRVDELNLKQYFNLLNYIKKNDIKEINPIHYVSFITKYSYDNIFNSLIDNEEALYSAIGGFVDVEKEKTPKFFMGQIIEKPIWTFGYRYIINMYTQKKDLSYYEMYHFIAALMLSKSHDLTQIKRYQNKLLNENYIKVLTTGRFFFTSLNRGQRGVMRLLSRRKKTILLILKKKRTGNKLTKNYYIIIQWSMKLKHFAVYLIARLKN